MNWFNKQLMMMQLCCTCMAYSICVLLFLNDWHSVEAAMNALAYSLTSVIEDAGSGELILI